MDIEGLRKLAGHLYKFYRYDLVWYIAIAFYAVLGIYYYEACVIKNPSKWMSIVSFAGLLGYYLHTKKRFSQGDLQTKRNPSFFMSCLTCKVVVWGALLVWIAVL